MENNIVTSRQLSLSLSATRGCAASAPATLEVQGIAARPLAPTAANVSNAAFVPFGAGDVAVDVAADMAGDVVVAVKAVQRDRAVTGMQHTGITAAYVPGSLAWSPPN